MMRAGLSGFKKFKAYFGAFIVIAIMLSLAMFSSLDLNEWSGLREIKHLECTSSRLNQRDGQQDRPAFTPRFPQAPDQAINILRCQGAFNLGADGDEPAALLIPVFRDRISVALNDLHLVQADMNQWQMPNRLTAFSTYVPLPKEFLQPGANRLTLTIEGLAGREAQLGKIYLGSQPVALKNFRRLSFVAVVLPLVLLGALGALVLMFFSIWNTRRQETAFGWIALSLALETLRSSPIALILGGEDRTVAYWNLVVPFSTLAYLMFARALVAAPPSRTIWLLILPPSLLVVAAALASSTSATQMLMPIGVALTFAYFMAASVTFASGWRRGVPSAGFLCLCTTFLCVFIVHDVLLSLRLIEGQLSITRPGLIIVLIAIITLMINRFTDAMTELDHAAETLRLRAINIEAQLRQAFEDLREQREKGLLDQERARLMRDLHDGLGGEMVTILALAEQEVSSSEDIAHHARIALIDMRLIIASLEDYGGDLGMALGAWRERAEPQIRAGGLTLHWKLGNLPENLHFGPKQILDILRILQESLVNVLKHAGASNITVQAECAGVVLTLAVEDDGRGVCGTATTGRGRVNMHTRARELGGNLNIFTSESGTRVELIIAIPPADRKGASGYLL